MQSSRPSERRMRSGRRYLVERREADRRLGDRRLQNMWVAIERRAGTDRRARADRRSGRDRRNVPDRRRAS